MPEPEIVTLSKMSDHLGARLAEVEAALSAATAEVAAASLLAERGGSDDALRRLAAAEKRRDKLTAELERLNVATGELERQLAAEREKAEADRRRDMLTEYVAHRDFVQNASRQLFEAVVALEPVVREARQRAKAATMLAPRLDLPVVNQGVYYPELGSARLAFKTVMGDVGAARDRILTDARDRVARDWHDTADGRRVDDLRTALGMNPGAE